jgi:hypothetical protein
VTRNRADRTEIADLADFARLDESRGTARLGGGQAQRDRGIEMPRLLRGGGPHQSTGRKGRADQSFQSERSHVVS